MHTVCELISFTTAADDAGLERDDVEAITTFLAENPGAGDVMEGTGGCRKLRWAIQGRGKSGGVRIVTFFTGDTLPVFMITVFGKGEKASLTKGERNALAKLTKQIVDCYRAKVVSVPAGKAMQS
jgi:hypothetical protein